MPYKMINGLEQEPDFDGMIKRMYVLMMYLPVQGRALALFFYKML